MQEWYIRNIGVINRAQQARLRRASVAVIGCGGLGGYVLEHLARLGVGTITCVDADVFTASNLNRQLNADMDTLGRLKAEVTADRLRRINPDIEVQAIAQRLSPGNARLLDGHDLVCDCLDNLDSRLLLEAECARRHIPWVHGAVGGLNAQVSFIHAGDTILERIYDRPCQTGPIVGMTAGVCAGLMAAQAMLFLTGGATLPPGVLLRCDVGSGESRRVTIKKIS